MSIEAKLRAHMLTLIERYCHFMNMAPTTVCGWAQGDARFYTKLKDGELLFSAHSYDLVVANLADKWPAGLDWPDGIPKIKLSDVRERGTPRGRKPQAPTLTREEKAVLRELVKD
jgi:hypothetical protein